MHIIGAIFIGFVVGLVARFLKPGRDAMGFVWTAFLGIVGSLIATAVGRAFNWYGPGEAAGFIASVVGAVVVLSIWAGLTRGEVSQSTDAANRDRWAA